MQSRTCGGWKIYAAGSCYVKLSAVDESVGQLKMTIHWIQDTQRLSQTKEFARITCTLLSAISSLSFAEIPDNN